MGPIDPFRPKPVSANAFLASLPKIGRMELPTPPPAPWLSEVAYSSPFGAGAVAGVVGSQGLGLEAVRPEAVSQPGSIFYAPQPVAPTDSGFSLNPATLLKLFPYAVGGPLLGPAFAAESQWSQHAVQAIGSGGFDITPSGLAKTAGGAVHDLASSLLGIDPKWLLLGGLGVAGLVAYGVLKE